MARLSVLLTLAFLANLALSVPQTKPLRGTVVLPIRTNTSTTALKLPLTTAVPSANETTKTSSDDDEDSPGAATTTTTVLPLVSNGTTIGNVSVEATTLPTPVNETGTPTTTSEALNASSSSRPVVVDAANPGFWKRLSWGHITLIVLGAAAALLMISCLMSCLVFGEGAFYLVSCGPCRKR